jgi:hypothetical protein
MGLRPISLKQKKNNNNSQTQHFQTVNQFKKSFQSETKQIKKNIIAWSIKEKWEEGKDAWAIST